MIVEERLGGIGWYELCTELTRRAKYPCRVVVPVLDQLSEKSGNQTINSPKSVEIWNPHHCMPPARVSGSPNMGKIFLHNSPHSFD
jgi:hypothetical protein